MVRQSAGSKGCAPVALICEACRIASLACTSARQRRAKAALLREMVIVPECRHCGIDVPSPHKRGQDKVFLRRLGILQTGALIVRHLRSVRALDQYHINHSGPCDVGQMGSMRPSRQSALDQIPLWVLTWPKLMLLLRPTALQELILSCEEILSAGRLAGWAPVDVMHAFGVHSIIA